MKNVLIGSLIINLFISKGFAHKKLGIKNQGLLPIEVLSEQNVCYYKKTLHTSTTPCLSELVILHAEKLFFFIYQFAFCSKVKILRSNIKRMVLNLGYMIKSIDWVKKIKINFVIFNNYNIIGSQKRNFTNPIITSFENVITLLGAIIIKDKFFGSSMIESRKYSLNYLEFIPLFWGI